MGLNAKKAGGSNTNRVVQPPMPVDTYMARLVQVIDLGLQPQKPWQGQDKPPAHQIMLTYEFVDMFCIDEDGKEQSDKPRWLSETIALRNLKAENAKSTKRYYAMDPECVHDGDFSRLIDTPVMVTIAHNKVGDKVYENISAVSTMGPRNIAKCGPLVNPPKVFDSSEPDIEIFGSLPEWVQEKIKGNLNFKGSKLEAVLGGSPSKKEETPEEDGDEDAPW